jgi:hypothetical protein
LSVSSEEFHRAALVSSGCQTRAKTQSAEAAPATHFGSEASELQIRMKKTLWRELSRLKKHLLP